MHIIVIIIASVVDALLINYSNLNDWSDDWVAPTTKTKSSELNNTIIKQNKFDFIQNTAYLCSKLDSINVPTATIMMRKYERCWLIVRRSVWGVNEWRRCEKEKLTET